MSKVYIGYVLDMSGSMGVATNDTKGSVANYIDKTKEELPEARFNLTVFDTVFETWVNNVPIRALDGNSVVKDYMPRGATALYDAIGKTIKDLKKVATSEDKVFVVITTDGEENSSRKETKETILNKITKLQKKGNWTFIYLGTNVDSWNEAQKIGILRGNTRGYTYGKGQFMAAGAIPVAMSAVVDSAQSSTQSFFDDINLSEDAFEEESLSTSGGSK